MTTRIQWNQQVERMILGLPEVRAALESTGSEIAARAKQNIRPHSSTIANSIVREIEVVDGSPRVTVVAKDFKSNWFENGTVKMSAKPFMKPAAEQLGHMIRPAQGNA